jgi:hypothetical protein
MSTLDDGDALCRAFGINRDPWEHRPPMRVQLLIDLTRYHPAYVAGVEGMVWHRPGEFDQFFVLRLDNGTMLDVLWQSVAKIKSEVP